MTDRCGFELFQAWRVRRFPARLVHARDIELPDLVALGLTNPRQLPPPSSPTINPLPAALRYPLLPSLDSGYWPLEPEGLKHLRIGLREDGTPYEINALGMHKLVGGVSGSGKSSWFWAALAAIAPYVAAGLVKLSVLDPKGGEELGTGEGRLFDRFACDEIDHMAKLLEEVKGDMRERQRNHRAQQRRKHVLSVDDPLHIVIVDEMTSLTDPEIEAKQRNKIAHLIWYLLLQGRSAGFRVWAGVQDIRKDTLKHRDKFLDNVALRMEQLQVDMILGDKAREKGALCDLIPYDPDNEALSAGVGYIMERGRPVMVRSFWFDDDAIERVVSMCGKVD